MLDYGYAEFDVRHRFVFGGIWELPLFAQPEGATRTLLGGWQLNWIFTARSGYPFTMCDCTNGFALLHARHRPGRASAGTRRRARTPERRTSSTCST